MHPLVAPAWKIAVGEWQVGKMLRFDVYSSRVNPADTAEVVLPKQGFPVEQVRQGQELRIWQGYRGVGLWLVFAGTLTSVEPGETVLLRATDASTKLAAKIAQGFSNVIPQEIFRYCLERAGVTEYRLTARRLAARPSFVARGTVAHVLRQVCQVWGTTDWAFYFEPEGTFWWGPWEESERYGQLAGVTLAYRENIITHEVRDARHGLLQTPALPFLRHSHRVAVEDPRHWRGARQVRIERVRYHHSREKARTWLEWYLPEN